MSNEELSMDSLYKKLEDIGFKKDFIKAIGLPDWWSDSLDELENKNKVVVYKAAEYISQRLFLDLKSLIKKLNLKVICLIGEL